MAGRLVCLVHSCLLYAEMIEIVVQYVDGALVIMLIPQNGYAVRRSIHFLILYHLTSRLRRLNYPCMAYGAGHRCQIPLDNIK